MLRGRAGRILLTWAHSGVGRGRCPLSECQLRCPPYGSREGRVKRPYSFHTNLDGRVLLPGDASVTVIFVVKVPRARYA